jgi:UDP-N-acetyl-2-amino-2-deoxyglucuronate dehydrogenase
MKQVTIKFAVAGTGWVAGEYLKAINENVQSEVIAVYSQSRQRASDRLQQLGVKAQIYENYEEMLKNATIDAVVLCSTPDVRPQQAIMAAQYGKHMVLEKPLALDQAQMWEMGKVILQSGVRTVASFVLRWNPAFHLTKALIEDDALGRIHMAQIDYWNHVGADNPQYRWSSGKKIGGSSMLSAGCHAVDALRYFAGDITEVTAYSCQTRIVIRVRPQCDRHLEIKKWRYR